MKRIQVKTGLQFRLHGRDYIIRQRLEGGEWQIEEIVTKALSNLKETALIQLLFQGDLEFTSIELTENNSKVKDYRQADFTQLPEDLRASARRKHCYISKVFESDLSERTRNSLIPIIEQVAREINDPTPPGWLTLYRWLKIYESSGKDIRVLVPRYFAKGNYQSKVQVSVKRIIDEVITELYLSLARPDVADVHEEIARRIQRENQIRAGMGTEPLDIPHKTTIYRAVSRIEPGVKVSGRYGKKMAGQLYDPVQIGPRPTRPLQRVEIDHTKLPLFVVDSENRIPIGTPWLTSAIDKYSGVTLGYYASFEPPSYLSVMQCLRSVIRPKSYLHTRYKSVENDWDTYGIPEVIIVDNAKEFYSTHFEDACLSLGIVIQYSPPGMPWYKSAIERYFGSLNSQLLSEQPGKTFSNFMKSHSYNPIENAVISFEALQEILHIFIVDIYNQSSHPELLAPRSQVWHRAIVEFPPALPASDRNLTALIGRIVERKITRKGIEFEGLIYNSSELAHLRSQIKDRTTVKYDPTDLSKLYVLDPSTYQFLEVPALAIEYTRGLSLWQHKVIKKFAYQEGEKVDLVALALAKEKIQKIVEREWKISKKGKTRQSMARWLGLGREGMEAEVEPAFTGVDLPTEIAVREQDLTTSSDFKAGISDLGSAFKESTVNSETFSLESTIHSPSENKGKSSKKSREKRTEIRTPEQKESERTLDTDSDGEVWSPDLSGWDVSVGLLK